MDMYFERSSSLSLLALPPTSAARITAKSASLAIVDSSFLLGDFSTKSCYCSKALGLHWERLIDFECSVGRANVAAGINDAAQKDTRHERSHFRWMIGWLSPRTPQIPNFQQR